MSITAAAAIKRPAQKLRKDAIINLRVPEYTRDLIDAAADTVGKTRTQFVVESAHKHAIDVLLDKKVFKLDEASFDAFVAALDNPPEPNQKLKDLLARKAPWEM